MNLQQKKELIRFIDFHSRARSLNQNSIQAIVSADDTKAGLMEIFDLLNKDVAVIGYSGSVKPTKFIEELVRPHVVRPNLELAYSQMSKDKKREAEALDWAEMTFKDIAHEKR